jgi:Xaa-Pro aminopeptidase
VACWAGRDGGAALPSGRAVDAVARAVIDAGGHGAHFGHGTGHGIGLATHEAPSLGTAAADTPLPSPTVFSVEPGVYIEGETGVRIEDLVALDAAAGRVERLTQFPREALVVGG